MKHVCITDTKKQVLYATNMHPGKEHDKTIFLENTIYSFLPENIKKYFDLAFLGIEKDCPELNNIYMPFKKPKKKELSKNKRAWNKRVSKKRVLIENTFAGVKRLKIMVDIFRNIKTGFSDNVFFASCGIWNFYLNPI